jgi:hypothetical protein
MRLIRMQNMLIGPNSLLHPEISFPIITGGAARSIGSIYAWGSRLFTPQTAAEAA